MSMFASVATPPARPTGRRAAAPDRARTLAALRAARGYTGKHRATATQIAA